MGISRLHFDDFRSDYLGEYEALCETALVRESGPQGPRWGWLMKKKTEGRKSLATAPLTLSAFYL
jgi:hypothetical protein